MIRNFLTAALCGLALSLASTRSIAQTEDDPVPKTVEGGAGKVREGGHQIGQGFRHVGRGIKKVFKGERSKDEFKKGAKIGTGARDVGLGTAGVGRGVGRGVRDGVNGEKADADRPLRDRRRDEDPDEEDEPVD